MQQAESVSASTAPPSAAEAMKTKRRKPSQLERESHLQKHFNCGERVHLSLECTPTPPPPPSPHPCYKCNISGHHSVRCPYSANRAPGPEASSSPSSAQSTPERRVRPTSGRDPSPSAAQPPPRGVLPPATLAPPPSLGQGLLALSTFLPLPPVGRGAQLLAALNRNRSATSTRTRQPAPSIPSRLQQDYNNSWGFHCSPFRVCNTLGTEYGLVSGRQQHSAGASTESSSASAAVPGPSLTLTQEQLRSSCSNTPKAQPHLTPLQGQSVRGEATGQSALSSSGTQGVSTSSSWTSSTLIRSLSLPGSSLQLPGEVRSPKGVSAPWVAHLHLCHLAGTPLPMMEISKGC